MGIIIDFFSKKNKSKLGGFIVDVIILILGILIVYEFIAPIIAR